MRSLNEPRTKRRVITLLKTNLRYHRLSTLNKYYPTFAFIVRFSSISNIICNFARFFDYFERKRTGPSTFQLAMITGA